MRDQTTGARVAGAAIVEIETLRALPASTRSALGRSGPDVCVVKVDRHPLRYSLILDLEWMTFARELDHHAHDLVAGLELPTAAVRAVVNGWEPGRPAIDATIQWTLDGVPHIGFTPSDRPLPT